MTSDTFEDWVRYIFDHPVTKPEWHWGENVDPWLGILSSERIVEYLTKFFSSPTTYLNSFSDAQLNQGLDYLVNASCGDYFRELYDSSVAWTKRRDGIQAISKLYTDIFARRCTQHLSHLDEKGTSPLNRICYMWWDIVPYPPVFWKKDTEEEVVTECLAVMHHALSLDSIACQESGLHGLGHFSRYRPQEVCEIVDGFLRDRSSIRAELRAYAECARGGGVQ